MNALRDTQKGMYSENVQRNNSQKTSWIQIEYSRPYIIEGNLPVLRYHKIMLIYPYSFWVVITPLFSWIIFINDFICILTVSFG